MPIFSLKFSRLLNLAGSVAVMAVVGAVCLAPWSVSVRAETAAAPSAQPPQTNPAKAGVEATEAQTETVEQRIANLRTALKITAEQELKWQAVANAMRENAAAMEKLVAEKAAQGSHHMTAIEDLKSYEKFTQAHADGLKNLIDDFEKLYNSMPDAQKKTADQVFENFGRRGARSPS